MTSRPLANSDVAEILRLLSIDTPPEMKSHGIESTEGAVVDLTLHELPCARRVTPTTSCPNKSKFLCSSCRLVAYCCMVRDYPLAQFNFAQSLHGMNRIVRRKIGKNTRLVSVFRRADIFNDSDELYGTFSQHARARCAFQVGFPLGRSFCMSQSGTLPQNGRLNLSRSRRRMDLNCEYFSFLICSVNDNEPLVILDGVRFLLTTSLILPIMREPPRISISPFLVRFFLYRFESRTHFGHV